MSEKNLFIPLKTEYYNAFLNGNKDAEYRLYGKRWNEKTCYRNRPVILSKGYGKANRLKASILDTELVFNYGITNIYPDGSRLIRIVLRNVTEI